MALPINIESLLSGSAVESNQLEYKEGWNPDTIYRSICAFANDFEDTGGGYIIVGVKEEHGHAVRPVLGVNPNLIEQIEKDMVGYNNLIRPYYQPRLFIEEVDGKTILVIKVTAGERRPYKVPDRITAKQITLVPFVLGHRPAQQGLRLIRLKGNTKLHSSTRASSSTTRIETVLPERTQSHRLVLEQRPAQ